MTEVDMTEADVKPVTTAWITRMNSPEPIKGHAYKRENNGAWCSCGHYLGGLAYDKLSDKVETAHCRRMHALHLVIVGHHAKR